MRACKFMKRALSQDEGTSSAEFALVVPVMAILFIGLIDVGSLAWTALQVQAAARAGTASALLHGYDDELITDAMTNATNLPITISTTPVELPGCPDASTGLTFNGVTATTTCPSGRLAGRYVSVEASANYVALFAWPGLSSPLTLTSKSSVRIP